ncbi:tRNA threonylcarbamoyladenosine dehydratase [Zygosaccharomyces mellis]|uniref:tRNA threonylcarbamoyladenosine dehydratase n=1 Tax=Zygosaccharomyces mellis TaxID=42258 RepID=A0A4C2E852_9SACH|nr:tRNA threonylcarbamoyladenosine dehydratase [Zygosaccharomyces mellis]
MAQDTWKVVVGTVVFTVTATKCVEYLWNYRQNKLPESKPRKMVQAGQYDDDLFREQLARNYAFLGEEGMQKLKEQYIVVVGAGGVGSWVVTMLVRSGCCRIRVIDFDQISLSSLNRHGCATLKDVGTPKVECLKMHMQEVAPWCRVEAINQLWTKDSAEQLLLGGGKPSIVVDCIDNIDTKVDLLEFTYKKNLPVISSMGASTKSDPTRINVGDITATEEDPLARSVRRLLKKRGVNTGIPVVFSAEKPDPRKAKLLPLPDEEYEKGSVGELSALKDFRVRILPVLGTMPGIFGLTIATWILTKVSGYPMDPIEGKNRIKVYDGIYQSLAGQMTRIGMPDQRVPISVFEISYILEEVFRGKSPVSGYSSRLTLSKWDPSKPVSLQNVIILTKEEQKEHERRVLNGGEKIEDVYSSEVLKLIEKRFQEEQYYSRYR